LRFDATKDFGILKVKKLIGADKIICFGDGINDVTMFNISDEKYAVENAVDEIKKIATGIIGSNENDGVARWLENNSHRY
jgi:hydroxymethylpyrimidine pyrophosphatase-like HAD family hydrolase